MSLVCVRYISVISHGRIVSKQLKQSSN